MKDGLKRKEHGDAAPLALLWVLADEAARQERSFITRIPSGGVVSPSRLGPSQDAPYGALALLRLDPDLGLTSWFQPVANTDVVVRGNVLPEGIILLRPNSGAMVVRQGDRRTAVTAREAVLVSGPLPAILRLRNVDRLDCLEVLGRDVSPLMAAAAAVLCVIHRDNAALSLLGNYGAALMRGLLPVATGTLREHAIRHMAGLVGIMCTDPAGLPPRVPVKRQAGRISAMKADIEVRLDERTMTAKRFAGLHGLSVRSLQKLFESEGQTFSQFVLERRLERAKRLLTLPAGERRSISEIAFDVGFGDLSYFNRTFRKRFGIAPRQAREHFGQLNSPPETKEADP